MYEIPYTDRFNSETRMLLNSFENFAIGKNNVTIQEIAHSFIIWHQSLKLENYFDEQKLKLHREMFLEINIRKMPLHCLKDVLQFLQDNPEIRDLPGYVKFIRVLLTIPTSFVRIKDYFLI